MFRNTRILLTHVVISILGVLVTAPSLVIAAQQQPVSLENQLKAALEGAQNETQKLGVLEPWQKVLYTEEVIPQYQRFIRDYRASNQGLKVVIDYDSLKHYLHFYGPKSLKEKDPRILVFLQPDPSCSKCASSLPEMTNLVRSRLVRRGLVPIGVDTNSIGSQMNLGVQANGDLKLEKAMELAKKKNAMAALVMVWSELPMDDIDTVHADEKRYLIRSTLQIGSISLPIHQKELLDTDSFEGTAAKLLGDIFTEIGAKLEVGQPILVDSGKEEVLLRVGGIKGFAQYIRIKNLIAEKLRDAASIQDRKFSVGEVTFAFDTRKSSEEIKIQLEKIISSESDPFLTVAVP